MAIDVERSTAMDAQVPGRSFKRPERPTFQKPSDESRYTRGRLALACRIIDAQGWGVGCAMYLSARDPQLPSNMFVLPAGVPLCSARASSFISLSIADGKVSEVGNEGDNFDTNAATLHRAVYSARPDLGGIIQGSSPSIRAFSTTPHCLKMILQDSCTFYKRVGDLSLADSIDNVQLFPKVKDALKDGKGLILRNRGGLVAGQFIDCCMSYYVRLESLCKCQLLAEAVVKNRGGDIIEIGTEEVEYTYSKNGSEPHAWLHSKPYFDRQEAKSRNQYME